MTRTPKLRFLSALLAVAMMLTFLPTGVVTVFAADTTFDVAGLRYTVNNDGENTVTVALVDKTDTSMTNVIIQSTVAYDGVTYTVTAIGDEAFGYVTTWDYTYIESYGMYGNTYIYAEGYNDILQSITIPASVTKIGEKAFGNCSSLETVTFEDGSKIKEIGEDAFCGCYSLKNIEIPTGITEIKDGTFAECDSLEDVTIPANVTSIGNQAFYMAYPSSVKLNEGLKTIGVEAFASYATGNAGWNFTKLTTITIPASVTSIGAGAFIAQEKLETVVFETGSQLKTIGDAAFEGQGNDESYGGIGLKSIVIPASVTSIGKEAFRFNPQLTSVTFESGSQLTKIGEMAFDTCRALKSIIIPKDVKKIEDSAFNYCPELESVTFEEGSQLTEIGDDAFQSCEKLECITIPTGVKTIGEEAFQGCKALTSVTLDKYGDLTTIEDNAFENCKLSSIEIPDKVTSIGSYAFRYCVLSGSITLPTGITSVGYAAFDGNSVTQIRYRNTENQWTNIGGYSDNRYGGSDIPVEYASKVTFKQQNGQEIKNVYAFAGETADVPQITDVAFAGWTSSDPDYLTLTKNATNFTVPTDKSVQTVTFTAKMKQTPTADMFDFTAPVNCEYDGTEKTATITPKSGITGMGTITLKYYSLNSGNQVQNPKNVGGYWVQIDVAEGDEYLGANNLTKSSDWKFTITKKSPNVSGLTIIVPADLTYDGAPKEVTATPNTESGITKAEVIYYEGESTTAMTEKPTNAGTYRYEVKVTGDNTTNDQTLKDDSWTFTIVKADPKASDFTFTTPANLTYNDTEKAATVAANAGINGMGSVTLKYYKGKNQVQGTPKDAGTYTVKIDVAEGDNYKAANDLTDTTWKFTIAKKTPTASDLTIKRPTNLVYDGTPKTVMVTPKENSGITKAEVNYYDENNNKLTGEPTNAGTYKYSIKLTGDSNTNNPSITNGAWRFTITKATPDVSDFTFAPPTNLTYDGNAKKATVEAAAGVTGMGTLSTTKYYKVENGVEEEVTENNGLPTLPGTYKVKISVNEGENYKETTSELTTDDWTFTIGTKTPSKGDIKDPLIPNNPTYDGTEKKVSVEPADGSVIDPNDVEVVYIDKDNNESTVAPKNAGDYTFKIKIKADSDGKYTEAELTDSTWTFTIEKAAPDASDFTFTAPSDRTYDGTAKTATVEVKTGINGMGDVTLKYFDEDGNPLQGTPKNAGTYTVKIDVAEGDNYKAANGLTDTAWTFTISKADLTKDDFELKDGNVSLKERIDGAGTVKTTYKRLDENGQPTGDDLDALPTDDGGVYQIYVTTEGGSNYNDLTTPTTDTSWTIRQDGKDRDLKGEGFVAKVNGTESKTAKWGQTVEIEPSEVPTGKKFKEWKIDGATLTDPDTTEKNSFVMGNSDVTITAVYEDVEYTLTVGGKTEKHLYNETVTLKDTPEAGMELDYWEVDGNKITGNTFPMPAKNVTAEAVYKAKSYTLTVDGKTEDHLYGSDVSVTAPAKDGYKFTGWTVEGVDVADKTSETLKFQMPAGNVTLTPSYEKIQTPVKPNPGEGEDPGSKPADPKPGKPETEKKTLTAEDFVFTAPSDNTADGTAKEASVSAKADGAGKITLKYYDEAGNLLDKAPTEPGSYTVRVDVTESDTCKALKDLTAPGWKFTIEKAKPVTSEISIDNGKAYLEDGETEINTAEAGQTVVVRVNPEAITEGFAFDKWEVVSGGITLDDETSPEIRFVMPAGKVELKATVKVKQTPSTALSPLEQAAATTAEVVVVGAGVAALGVSVGHIATELYLKWVLPAGIIPANREQLALLLWNKENQPAADSTELYTDISADDTDAQTAAHWVIESGLMDLVDGDEADVFEPDKPVTVYEVAAAWNKKPAQSR